MEEEQCEPWFNAEIVSVENEPEGFKEWTDNICYYKYQILLPDNTRVSAKLFIDLNGNFKNYEYTNYLLNRYNEIQDI